MIYTSMCTVCGYKNVGFVLLGTVLHFDIPVYSMNKEYYKQMTSEQVFCSQLSHIAKLACIIHV